jgi:Mg2+-importing ATPase
VCRAKTSGRRVKGIVWLVGAALLGAVISAASHFTEERAFARLLDEAQPLWLLVAAVLQVGTYLAEAEVWRGVTAASGKGVSLGRLYRLSVAKLFVDQAIPSGGMSGTLLYVEGLRHAGIARAAALAGVVVATFSYYASYVICLSAAIALASTRTTTSTPIASAAIVFLLVSATISIVVLRQPGRTSRDVLERLESKAPIWSRGLRLLQDADPRLARDRGILARAVIVQIVIVLLDAATMWACLRALGAPTHPGAVFAGYMFSSLLRTLSVVPGGLGAFEAASTYMLHAGGASVEAALSATLLFRGFSFWLPMLPGLLFARREVRTSQLPLEARIGTGRD